MWFAALFACDPGAAGPKPPESVFVVVAARELNVGVPIGEQDVYGLKMEVEYVPDDVFLDPLAVIGRVPKARILPNEPIRGRRLADEALQKAVQAIVPPDRQVVTMPLDAAVAVEPAPGDPVDVWLVADNERTLVVERTAFLRIDARSVALMLTDPEHAAVEAARTRAGDLVVVPTGATKMNFGG